MFSKSLRVVFSSPRKIMLFLSFQMTQEVANQIINMKEHRDLAWPEAEPNWRKCSSVFDGKVVKTCNQFRTNCQSWAKSPQFKNKCSLVSCTPSPPTHIWSSNWIIPRHKLALYGNLFRKSLQAKIKTLSGMSFLQRRSLEIKGTPRLRDAPSVRVR